MTENRNISPQFAFHTVWLYCTPYLFAKIALKLPRAVRVDVSSEGELPSEGLKQRTLSSLGLDWAGHVQGDTVGLRLCFGCSQG